MTTNHEARWVRGLMVALAVGLLVLALRDLTAGLYESRDWPVPAAFFFVPAGLWMVAAWRFGTHLRRWRQLLLTGSLAYMATILATVVTVDLTGDKLDGKQLAGVALSTAVLLLLPIAGLSAGKLAGMEGNYDETPRPWIGAAAVAAGALGVIASLFLRMESATGWDFLRRDDFWVTASYGSVSWLKSSVDWIVRCDYALVLVISIAAFALLVPGMRARLSSRTQQVFRHIACAAALLVVVDLYCGWTVFLSERFFPENPFFLGVVTLAGAALWLVAVAGGAGSSPRAERVRIAMMWVFFPMLACDVGSILYLPSLQMPGNICLLLGALATAYGVARLVRDTAPAPRRTLAAAA
jgi:hypothetical protein